MSLNTGARSRTSSTARPGNIVRPMGRTHYCPTDSVHYTWDVANEPLLTIADGDTVVFETRDVSDNQIGPGSDSSVIANLDWDRVYPLAGPSTSRAPSRATRSRSRSSTCTPRLGLDRDPARPRPAGRRLHRALPARLRPLAGRPHGLPRGHRDPALAVHGHDGRLPGGRERAPVMPPGTFGGNLDTRQLVKGTTLFLPVRRRGRAVLDRRRPRLPGRRRDLRHRASRRRCTPSCASRCEKGRSIPAPQYRTAPGPLTPAVNYGAFYGTTGVGGDLYVAAQDATRAMIDHLGAALRPLARGRLPALQPRRRPQDLRDRRRGPVRRLTPCCRSRSS